MRVNTSEKVFLVNNRDPQLQMRHVSPQGTEMATSKTVYVSKKLQVGVIRYLFDHLLWFLHR